MVWCGAVLARTLPSPVLDSALPSPVLDSAQCCVQVLCAKHMVDAASQMHEGVARARACEIAALQGELKAWAEQAAAEHRQYEALRVQYDEFISAATTQQAQMESKAQAASEKNTEERAALSAALQTESTKGIDAALQLSELRRQLIHKTKDLETTKALVQQLRAEGYGTPHCDSGTATGAEMAATEKEFAAYKAGVREAMPEKEFPTYKVRVNRTSLASNIPSYGGRISYK